MTRTLLFVAGILLPSLALAAAGDAELKQAIALSLSAESATEQGAVVKHCKQALEAGLSEEEQLLANRLASQMLARRGRAFQTEGMLLASVAQSAAARQMLQQALANYEEAVRHHPQQLPALLGVAAIHSLPGGDAKRALEVLDQALALNKHSPDVYRMRATLYLQARKLDEALADLHQAQSLDQNDAATWQLLATASLLQKDWDKSRAAFDRAIELQPDNADHFFKRAQLKLVQGDNEGGLADLDKSLAIHPRAIEALQLRLNLHLRAGQQQQALADLDTLLEIRPTNRSLSNARARLLAQLNQLDARIKSLETELAVDPVRTTELRLQLATLYARAGKVPQALAMYARVLSQHPNLAEIQHARGDLYISTGDLAAAKADYEAALNALPGDPTLMNNVAWLLATSPQDELRDGKRAVELATKACELTQYKVPALLGTLSAAHAEVGDFKQAIEWGEKALALATGPLKEQFERELKSYRAGEPYRDTRGRTEEE